MYICTHALPPTPGPRQQVREEGGTKEPVELRFVRLRPQEPGNLENAVFCCLVSLLVKRTAL